MHGYNSYTSGIPDGRSGSGEFSWILRLDKLNLNDEVKISKRLLRVLMIFGDIQEPKVTNYKARPQDRKPPPENQERNPTPSRRAIGNRRIRYMELDVDCF
jgi:hypothetical protein